MRRSLISEATRRTNVIASRTASSRKSVASRTRLPAAISADSGSSFITGNSIRSVVDTSTGGGRVVYMTTWCDNCDHPMLLHYLGACSQLEKIGPDSCQPRERCGW